MCGQIHTLKFTAPLLHTESWGEQASPHPTIRSGFKSRGGLVLSYRSHFFFFVTSSLLLSAFGCQNDLSPRPSFPANHAQVPIGPQGGSVALASGARLDIPASCLDSEREITLTKSGSRYHLEPSGPRFRCPATLSLPRLACPGWPPQASPVACR